MLLDLLNKRLLENGPLCAVVEGDNSYSYSDLSSAVDKWLVELDALSIQRGQVIGVQSDYTYRTISLLIALFRNGNVVALMSPHIKDVSRYCEDAFIEYLFVQKGQQLFGSSVQRKSSEGHYLLKALKEQEHSGFIIFSSGTTGRPKAILHDLEKFLSSFIAVNKAYRTLAFLLLDHIAGLDTLFYTLFSGGSLVLTSSRGPNHICKLIMEHRVDVLPVSPSFLNLLIISGEYSRFDLSSLKVVSYGSEPMGNSVLNRLPEVFPNVRILQKYGTSEFGSPRSKTRGSDSSWLKIDSENFQTKVENGVLWVKSRSTMLGYLNADGMLEEDGWLCTGDMVEVDKGWLRIIGRESDIINVGGEKVFPVEVESVLNELDAVDDCIIYGEPHTMLGNQVCAKVRCGDELDTKALKKTIRKYCLNKLERYKVPSKFEFTSQALVNKRHKKQRVRN